MKTVLLCVAFAQSEGVLPGGEALSMLEAIRSAYAQGRDKDCLLLADRALAEVARAGGAGIRVAELHFWRGASLRRLGRPDEALAALDRARALGFREPELYLERGLTRRNLGHEEQAENDRQEAERLIPDDLERRERLNLRWQREAQERTRFHFSLAPQFGYDSNVVGLDEDTPLRQGDVDVDSLFVGAYLDAQVFLVRQEHQIVRVGYQALAREYAEESDLSFVDNVVSLVGRQPLLEVVDAEARAALEEAFLRDDGHFRTQRTIGPAFLLQPWHQAQARLWAEYSEAQYYAGVPDVQDRDGTITRGGVSLAFDLGRGWTATPHASYTVYDAEGDDYESEGWEIGATVTPEELAGFLAAAGVTYGHTDYDNPNSLTGFTAKRKDRPFSFTLTVRIRLLEPLLGAAPSVSFSYVRHDSNLGAFDYSRWTPSVELGLGLLSF
jgi:tetratricopeptide (TPR) repeat protein